MERVVVLGGGPGGRGMTCAPAIAEETFAAAADPAAVSAPADTAADPEDRA